MLRIAEEPILPMATVSRKRSVFLAILHQQSRTGRLDNSSVKIPSYERLAANGKSQE
jgi:hypothetical protein